MHRIVVPRCTDHPSGLELPEELHRFDCTCGRRAHQSWPTYEAALDAYERDVVYHVSPAFEPGDLF